MSQFELIGKATINDSIDVHKYRSKTTGLTVVFGDIEGPIVTGHFVLATEAHDDDGLPHTLEHLIFLGSEKYPYKGVLDLLANRCFASGTNAWTDTDHTCYTMTTAGSEGFLELIPIYLDHILYPTLSDSGFKTEVHHISGDGEDGGVVYCEMQGRQNTGESRTILQLLRKVYPNSGYSSETGGIMHNLRTSTNNEKVRKYHAQFYRPENLTLIITGQVKPSQVFKALETIESKILSKGNRKPFERPWQTAVDPMEKSEDLKILFPSDEEDCGLVYIGFRGPNCVKDYLELTACNVLLRYLSDTSVSPLQQVFVEVEDPYASKVSHSFIENLESLLYFVFDNVPIPKIDLVVEKLQQTLGEFEKGTKKIDMKRMRLLIEREILEALSGLERFPHDLAASHIIGDVIYGNSHEDFTKRLNVKKQFETLLNLEENYWIELINKYLTNSPYVCVRAFPSIEEQNRMSKEEIERIEKQRLDLGVEGLKRKAIEIRDAMISNEIEPPESMLTEVPVPSVDNINFHYMKIYKSNEMPSVGTCVDFSEVPVYTEIYDVHTNFIYCDITLNSEGLDPCLKQYLNLFADLILESPVKRNGVVIPYEEVVAVRESLTISCGAGIGLNSKAAFSCGPFSHVVNISLQVDPQKYEESINWILDMIKSSIFTEERVKVFASKMFNAVSKAKRVGNSAARELMRAILYPEDSNVRISSMLKQQKFFASILERIDIPAEAQQILKDLNSVRSYLLQNQNVGIHIAVNLKQVSTVMKSVTAPWKTICEKDTNKKKELIVIPDWKIMQCAKTNECFQGTVVGIGSVESAFLVHATPSLNDFLDCDLPAIMLFLQYLTQLEGPLWRQIRGQGLAYGYNIIARPHEGLLSLTLYRATNVVAAFKETKAIIEAQLLPDSIWDPNLLESARSSLIFEIIERERSIGNLVIEGLLFSYKKVSADYNQQLVKQVNLVTQEKLNEVGKKYVSKLFSSIAKTVIVCHPDKVKEIADAFACMDRGLTSVMSLEESILA